MIQLLNSLQSLYVVVEVPVAVQIWDFFSIITILNCLKSKYPTVIQYLKEKAMLVLLNLNIHLNTLQN